jgi:hypothetical protein
MYFNTGTFLDNMTGKYVLGYDGKWYLNGGIGCFFMMIMGFTSKYKTTAITSFYANMLGIYPDMELLINDTEDSINEPSRIARTAKFCPHPVEDRIIIPPPMNIGEYHEFLIETEQNRLKQKDKLWLETPYLNRDGKRIRTLLLECHLLDSISKLKDLNAKALLDKNSLTDEKANMYWANLYRRRAMLSDLSKWMTKELGLSICWVSHMGEEKNFSGGPPKPKKQQFMKQGQTTKGTGASAAYDATVQLEARDSVFHWMKPGSEDPVYATSVPNPADLNKVTMFVHKGKNNIAGVSFDLIVSQTNGLQNHLTNVEYCWRNQPWIGMAPKTSTTHFAPGLLPEKRYTRNAIYEAVENDAKLRRAFELIAGMKFIVQNTDRKAIPVDVDKMDFDKISENLVTNHGPLVEELLNSRGYWTYVDDGLEYYSPMDALILFSKYQ